MSEKPVILVVEDSPSVRDAVVCNLMDEGYDVHAVDNAGALTEKLRSVKPDTILLDRILPDGEGLNLIRNIREYTDAPIIVISGKSDLVDKIVGLEMGADDYIGKPLHMKEVAARVKAHVRRYKAINGNEKNPVIRKNAQQSIKFGNWVLDRERFQVYNALDQSANLTIKEFRLLEALVLEANRVLTREQLLDKARSGEYNTTDRAVDVQILRIRKKMGDTSDPPDIIRAVRGVGYTLAVKTEAVI